VESSVQKYLWWDGGDQQRDQALINPSLEVPLANRLVGGAPGEPLMRFGQTTIADKSCTALVRF